MRAKYPKARRNEVSYLPLSMPLRPSCLNFFFASLQHVPGIGPKTMGMLNRLCGRGADGSARVLDLLFHLPYSVLDRRPAKNIATAPREEPVTLIVEIAEHFPPSGRSAKSPWRVLVRDESGDVQLNFFHPDPEWIQKILPLGQKRWICGKLQVWDGYLKMNHPDHILTQEAFAALPPFEPLYPLTEGMRHKYITKILSHLFSRFPSLPEWHTTHFTAQRGWPSFQDALKGLHHPQGPKIMASDHPFRQRLAYDELLAHQLALRIVRSHIRSGSVRKGQGHISEGKMIERVISSLPFELTGAQQRAIAEIRADLSSDRRMLRLLQGDVGSGKTLVALCSLLHVVEAGRQAAMMAPTEILARQHFERLLPLLAPLEVKMALITGRDGVSKRRDLCAALAAGEIDMAIGTHALLEEEIRFKDLGLAIIDEQHRFGVRQRLTLGSKGDGVDILVMTATPIPRTLVLASYGDMEVSVLNEKPKGRHPIETKVISLSRLHEIVQSIGRALAQGTQVYWVCPLVEESETLDLAAAQERYHHLYEIYGDKVGLLHGQMKGRQKDNIMANFIEGNILILIATTIIEVGVDVPRANIMIIEHAERFGLAQLHQLRGRIGRGHARSSCLLLYKAPLSHVAHARLSRMRETQDGFEIAQEDLRLRGEGEILGTRQSGLPAFRLAMWDGHIPEDLLQLARDEAKLIFHQDPHLTSERGHALRLLLYLFEKEEGVRLLQAG